jgi:hypothetical protein
LCNLVEPTSAPTSSPVSVVETTVQKTQTGLSSLFSGLGGFTTSGVCFEMAEYCSYDGECCSQNCHNDSCTVASGRYSNKSKDASGYDLSTFGGFFNRGDRGNARGRRGLRGLKGAVSKLVVD